MATNKPELASARLVVSTSFTPRASIVRFRRVQEQGEIARPQAYVHAQVDGRISSYFEWLGAGVYCPDRHALGQNGRPQILRELRYGFDERFLYLRADPLPGLIPNLGDSEFRITLQANEEVRLLVGLEGGRFAGCLFETEELCLLGPHELVGAAFEDILEVSIARKLVRLSDHTSMCVRVELWRGNAVADSLPREGSIEVELGAAAFAWTTD